MITFAQALLICSLKLPLMTIKFIGTNSSKALSETLLNSLSLLTCNIEFSQNPLNSGSLKFLFEQYVIVLGGF